jgi:hypothetical protein
MEMIIMDEVIIRNAEEWEDKKEFWRWIDEDQ